MLNLGQTPRGGKLRLFSGDFVGAPASHGKANAYFRRRELRLTLLGLRSAPRFTAFAPMMWDRCLLGIKRLAVPKKNSATRP